MKEIDKEILLFIKSYIDDKGYSPSVEDIKNEIGKSKSVIHSYLVRLVNEGYIKKESGKSRTIRIIRMP